MRKAFRHTGVLMMVAVVALGLLGAAYTLWYEKLTLETNISTGTLNADWSFHAWTAPTGQGEGSFAGTSSTTGSGKPVVALPTNAAVNGGVASLLGLSGSGTGSANFTHSNFWVGTVKKPTPNCAAQITDTGNTLELTMSGLFPYAGCEFVWDLHTTGTVPFHMAVASQQVLYCDTPGCTPTTPVTGNLPWTRGVVTGSNTSNYNACLGLLAADWKWTIPGIVMENTFSPLTQTTTPVQVHAGTDLSCDVMYVLDENWAHDNLPYTSNQGLTFKVITKYAAFQWNESPSAAALATITAP